MSVVVDALGKQCPIPVVMAKKALAELQTPDTLEILVDNEAAVQNLSKLAASCQLPVRAEKTGEKRFSVTMEVSAYSGFRYRKGEIPVFFSLRI